MTLPSHAPPRAIDPAWLGQRRSLLLAAGLFALPFAISATLAWFQYQAWSGLKQDGVVGPAEVVGASHYAMFWDRIRIGFASEDGQLIEASIPIGELSRYRSGTTVMVRYDPANPRRVQTLEDWSPPYVWTALSAAQWGSIATALLWCAWRWPHRLCRWPAGKLRKPPERTSASNVWSSDTYRPVSGLPGNPGVLPPMPPRCSSASADEDPHLSDSSQSSRWW